MSLVLSDIRHHYGETQAVASASLEASPGEILCLFGPSGCGKTTLLRLAAGLERVQRGSVDLDGKALSTPDLHTPPEDRPIGFVFQDYVLFPHLTAAENVAFGLNGMVRKERRARVEEELTAVDLEGFGGRYPHELSGGQQQRLALARAFARRPRAMLLDEPFASIDAVRRRRLRDDIRRILKTHDAAAILVTHDPEEALALGDRVAIMKEGRIVETAAPKKLFEAPKTPEGAAIFPNAQTLRADRAGGRLHTAFGELAGAVEGADGPVSVITRDGGVLCELDDNGPAIVTDCRFAGPDWRILLEGKNGETVRAQRDAPLETGARARIAVDPLKMFVFARPPA